ncbi:unnamed protein product [Diabrotica balteata]|uniref:C2H2-type domain-containing protein n=1 Tax=Diabrotica balteata TaxID=107213 RepID=A0A9N9SNS2_DIABA|nr:unnamed protein product [Diabrotica balteata]
MEESDIDDIFDEEVEKSKEIKAFQSIKQETPFSPENTELFTNLSLTNKNMLQIKSENFYEELNDNFELKLEDVDLLKIEIEDTKQLHSKNIKLPKKKSYMCVMCQKRFHSARRRNNHLHVHFDIPVKTKNGKSSSSSGFFGTQIFVCGFCGQFHLNKKQILNHCQQYYIKTRRHIGCNRKKTNSTLYENDVFKSEVKLETEGNNTVNNMHLLGLPFSKISNRRSSGRQLKRFDCRRCYKIFSNKTELDKHLQNHDKYKCEICSKEYLVKRTFQLHMLSHEEDTFKDNQTSKPYVICYICSKFFASKHALRCHLVSHTGERKYSCNHCSKRYRYEQDLKRHMVSHTGRDIKLFECCHCYKVFNHKGHLNRHLEGHFIGGFKNYKCDICATSFQRKENLYVHTRRHNKDYTRKNIFTKRGPFECKKCGKKYIFNNSLQRHVKNAHEGQRYICAMCNKSLKSKESLVSHFEIHKRKQKIEHLSNS